MRSLPGWIERRLSLADELCERAKRELTLATAELLAAGWSRADIARLCVLRLHLVPRPAATISNVELARHGLANHPDAIGVRWDDRGRATWVTCRECVCREDYVGLPPDEESALLFIGPIHCDACDELYMRAEDISDDDGDRARGDAAPASGEGG
jgi:hypothetical protein